MIQTVHSSRAAFTRVELVAAIAMIGLLVFAGIPLQAIQRNADASSAAVDLNNVRQIMAAVSLYASDHTDLLPYPTWGTLPGGSDGWAYATQNRGRFPGLPENIPNLRGVEDHSAQLPWAERLRRTFTSLRVLMCPKDI